jgi:uncharacterized repeat protein (TIGR01451 family)
MLSRLLRRLFAFRSWFSKRETPQRFLPLIESLEDRLSPALLAILSGPSTATAGSDLTYTLRVSNAGTTAAQNVTITDALPSGESFVSQTQTSGPTVTLGNSGNTVSDTLASLPGKAPSSSASRRKWAAA